MAYDSDGNWFDAPWDNPRPDLPPSLPQNDVAGDGFIYHAGPEAGYVGYVTYSSLQGYYNYWQYAFEHGFGPDPSTAAEFQHVKQHPGEYRIGSQGQLEFVGNWLDRNHWIALAIVVGYIAVVALPVVIGGSVADAGAAAGATGTAAGGGAAAAAGAAGAAGLIPTIISTGSGAAAAIYRATHGGQEPPAPLPTTTTPTPTVMTSGLGGDSLMGLALVAVAAVVLLRK